MPSKKSFKVDAHKGLQAAFAWDSTGLTAGVDEAGRGAWAGPLVAGAVILDDTFEPQIVNDSKVLTAKQREKMFVHIARHAVSWAVSVVPPVPAAIVSGYWRMKFAVTVLLRSITMLTGSPMPPASPLQPALPSISAPV